MFFLPSFFCQPATVEDDDLQLLNTDIQLWVALKNGDKDALGLLFSRYYPILIRYGSKFCNDQAKLEDCIQDLFAEIWQSTARPELQSVKAYLLKALKYKIYRRKSRNITDEIGDDLFELSHDHLLIHKEDERIRVNRLMDAMNDLPARQREIIYLKIYQELSYEEISEVMNINYQVARNLFSQALGTLRKIILLVAVLSGLT